MLGSLYRRDVVHWGWNHWIDLVRKFGSTPMGFSWVILPYKGQELMPALRRRMNEIYYAALQNRAAEYGLQVYLDDGSNKLILTKPRREEEK